MKKIIFSIFLVIIFFLLVINAHGTTYWSSPSGSGSACSDPSPCSLSTGLSTVTPGDTLHLKDGTYNSIFAVQSSGTSGSYITIDAENDGKAIIDGQGVRRACYANGKSYVNIQGIVCKNSNVTVFEIANSNHLNIRRVSANNVTSSGNYMDFEVSYSNNILLEDTAAYGTARVLYNIYECQDMKLRRLWGKYTNNQCPSCGPACFMQLYGTDDSIVENNIGVRISFWPAFGINIWAQPYNITANNNKIYGSVMYGQFYSDFYVSSQQNAITGNQWKDDVGIGAAIIGFYARADTNATVNNITIVGQTGGGNGAFEEDSDVGGAGMVFTVKNSNFSGNTGYGLKRVDSTLNHSYNNFYSNSLGNYYNTSQGTGEIFVNPSYDTATYGKGAYLMIPSALQGQGESGANIGGEILFRYVDGNKTSEPLWPWPMEARICAETGYSVTYENPYAGCSNGGGIWKVLPSYGGGGSAPTLPGDASITSSGITYNSAYLSWGPSTDVDNDLSGYKVERCTDSCDQCPTPSTFSEIGETVVTQYDDGTEFGDGNLQPSTTYCYRVYAFDSVPNNSGFYDEEQITTSAAPGGGQTLTNNRVTSAISMAQANCTDFSGQGLNSATVGGKTVYTGFDNCGIYFCSSQNDTKINSVCSADSPDCDKDDGFTLIFDTDHDGGGSLDADDRVFICTASGTKAEYKGDDSAWDAEWTCSAHDIGTLNDDSDTDTSYVIKGFISWSELGITLPLSGAQWGLEIIDNDKSMIDITQTAWSNSTGGTFYDMDGAGTMNFQSHSYSKTGTSNNITTGNGMELKLGP